MELEQWVRGIDDQRAANSRERNLITQQLGLLKEQKSFVANVPGQVYTTPSAFNVWTNLGVNVQFSTRSGGVLVSIAAQTVCAYCSSAITYRITDSNGGIPVPALAERALVNDRRSPWSEFDRPYGGDFLYSHPLQPGTYVLSTWVYAAAITPLFGNETLTINDLTMTVMDKR